jgi:NADPH2:quinone reductase
MKASVYYETGGPEVFRYEDVADPEVGRTDVLISVEAISIEGGDTLNRLQGDLASVPHIVGYQCAGTVTARGDDVTAFSVGDRVVTTGMDGSHAELRAANQAGTWAIPRGLSTKEAACVPIAFGTASDCLFEFGRLHRGETVLIHAGASGVGIAAIQMASQAGARVLATASSDERLERLHAFGLHDGINYATTNFADEVRRLTGGRGADVIVDSVGGPTLQRSLTCLAYRGRCVTLGNAGREETATFDLSSMRGNNQALISYFLGAELYTAPRAHTLIAQILDDVAAGRLSVVLDRQFALKDAAEAHAYIESRQAFGRVLLIP